MLKYIKNIFKTNIKHNIWEELTEKQTTKWWYFLLFLMFFAIISTSQWTINIIQDIPDKPQDLPFCIERMINTFENKNYWNYYSNNLECSNYELISSKPKYDFTSEYDKLINDYKNITELKQELNDLERKKENIENNISNTNKNYDTSLTEDIANEDNKIYDKWSIQYKLQELYDDLEKNKNLINDKENQITNLIDKNSVVISKLRGKIERVEKEYDKAYLVYRIYIAILSFIFSIIIFLIVYKLYSKLKKENSPYSIIFSVASFAYGFILLQVILLFLWDIIPHRIFEYIVDFLTAFKPIIYLLQFIWPVFIIWIFWFIVYKIQKRLYSKENIIKRFVADKKCPNCWNHVDIKKPYCALCSYEIQITCPHCKKYTVQWMPFCSNCWNSLTDKK